MSKQPNKTVRGFGRRIAQLRKSAGYTQQQLADKIGVSRRMIAYYEGETGHPPTSFLADLARIFAVTTDTLLGIEPMKKARIGGTLSTRWERRVRQIERLDAHPKQRILTFIDAILTAEQGRQSVKP
jgi:transcriptional regulator with XRE-family HTH domain